MIASSGLMGYDRTTSKAAKRYGLTPGKINRCCDAGTTDWEAAEWEAKQIAREASGEPRIPGRHHNPFSSFFKPVKVTAVEQRVRVIHKRLMRLARQRVRVICRAMVKQGFDGIDTTLGRVTRSLWDADHIMPVVKGGGGCGLENYRTLCVPCHKKRTAALADQRAKERRGVDPQQ